MCNLVVGKGYVESSRALKGGVPCLGSIKNDTSGTLVTTLTNTKCFTKSTTNPSSWSDEARQGRFVRVDTPHPNLMGTRSVVWPLCGNGVLPRREHPFDM